MTQSVPIRSYFVHNFIGYQKAYQVDYYVFASFNKRTNTLTICGYIGQEEFFKRVAFYPEGTTRIRFDGTSFHTFAPLYEIRQEDFILLTP